MWIQLALLAIQMILGEVTRPRPKKIGFEEFKQTNGPSEIRPIPYIGGTVEITPSRHWYGDFTQRAVERDSHWSDYLMMGLSAVLLDTITVAYRYYCGEAFQLCFGPDTHVERVTIGERLMYQAVIGTDNAGGGFLIDDPQAWGGDQPPGEGGQYSWVDITRGNYTDPTNAYLESLLSTPPNKTPSGRGVSWAVSRGRSGFTESGYFAAGGVGFTPRFKEWKFVLRRQPDNLLTGFHKVRGPGETNRRHMNPAETIYEWSTSNEYGAKCPEEELNLDSFRSCAETMYNEDCGWSGKIEQQTSPRAVVENVLSQIDGLLDPSPSLGLTLRLIRRDYSFGSLRALTQDEITDVSHFSPGTYEDTVNKIIVPFFDPDNNFTARPGLYVDPANVSIQDGRIIPQTQDYLGVGDYPTANMLATRDGRALSIPRAVMDCKVRPSWGRLAYMGEVVRLQWSSPTFEKLMRVLSVTPATHNDFDYSVEMIEDQFASGLRTFGEPGATSHEDPSAGLDTAPPSATWNNADFPPDGLQFNLLLTNTNQFQPSITGGIVFGSYSPGGQYARLYVTEPGGVQILSPVYLVPDDNNEATFRWPAIAVGGYQFCVQTYSIRGVTNGVKFCESIDISAIGSPSASQSSSVSPSTSSSISPSSSISSSPSGSVSPSASLSPSASGSASSSVSASQSASVSPSSSISPSSSLSPSSSFSPSSSTSLSVSPSASASPSDIPPFDPTDTADCTTWVEASNETGFSDGDALQFLQNFGSTAIDADQGTAGDRAHYKVNIVNGLPVYRFDHSDSVFGDFYRINTNSETLVDADGYTVFAVINMVDTGSSSGTSNINSAAICGDGGTNGWGVAIKDSKFRIFHESPSAVNAEVTYTPGNWYIVEAWYDGTNINIRVNGGTAASTATTGNPGTGTQFRIGRTNGSANRPNCDLPGLFIWDRPLDSTERQTIREDLSARYNITL